MFPVSINQTIPASGLCASYNLCRNDKPKLRGTISLQLSIDSLAARKFNNISHHDRRQLLRILLQHELNISKMASYDWRGQFNNLGEAILAHSGHTANVRAHTLAQWSEFTAFHTVHQLSLELFENLLMVLPSIFKCNEITQNEMHIFWDGVKKLLPSCFAVLRNSQHKHDTDMESFTKSLSIVSTINRFTAQPPHDFELFPTKIHGWLDKCNGSISSAVEQAIRSRAQDYLLKITEFQFVHQENIESNLMNIKVMDLIEMDLQQVTDVYNKLFMQ